ncbi:hypothetical protein T484DRAFT_1577253, partial [Baffinella frigidus]
CEACPVGTYKDAIGPALCTACPVHTSSSVVGSSQQTDCICNAGYTGPNGGTCEACEAGTYKASKGSQTCTSPGPTTTTPEPCQRGTECPDNSFWGVQGCDACQVDTYKVDTGDGTCAACRSHSSSIAGSAGCICDSGYTGVDVASRGVTSELCSVCLAGTYKETSGFDTCTACPMNTSSSVGSSQQTDCICNAGYTGPNGGTCEACEAGTYKASKGSQTCTLCDPGKTSAA